MAPKKAADKTAAAPKAAKGSKPAPKKVAAKGEAGEKAPAKVLSKARSVQKKVVKGLHGTRVKKVRTSVKFYRPKTFKPPRAPKYPRFGQSFVWQFLIIIFATLNILLEQIF